MIKPPNPFEREARWDQWVFGVALPLLLLWPALRILVNQTGFLIGRPILRMAIHGFDAALPEKRGVPAAFVAIQCSTQALSLARV